jgi:glycosyltransferase involved in cell wall biosynthesis
MKTKKNILVLTDVEFWLKGAGHQRRIGALIGFLSGYCALSVVFIGPGPGMDAVRVGVEYGCTLDFLEKDRALGIEEYGRRLSDYVAGRVFEWCIVEYLHLSFYTQFLEEGTRVVLDTHDILHQRFLSFQEHDHESGTEQISRELEFEFFGLYDFILVISEPDRDLLRDWFPEDVVLLCPHPSSVFVHPVREPVTTIGFVASAYVPNVDGIGWFCREVWPAIRAEFDVRLAVFGNIKSRLGFLAGVPGVELRGYVAGLSEVYAGIDIAINPVRFGAGLKIKTVEALANGIPLVTTTHGARGLEPAMGKALLVAETAEETVAAIRRLMGDAALRREMGDCGRRFIGERYSPEECFGPLLQLMDA